MRRIGVYGGAFDPIHIGHLRTALEVRQQLQLDEVRLVPSGNPPHRAGARAAARHRQQMLTAALADADGMVVDDCELRREARSYSFDTITEMQDRLPGCTFVLIIGMDQFCEFKTWHRWQQLLEHVELAVMERPGERINDDARSIMEDPHNRVHLCAVTQLDVSSTRIRRDLAGGMEIQFLVPYAVRLYIKRNNLYGGNSDC